MIAVSPKLFQVIQELQSVPSLSGSFLAGGTNLALRFNHRRSVDIDLCFDHIIGRKGYEKIAKELSLQFESRIPVQFPCNIDDQYIFMRAFVFRDGETIKIEVLQNMKILDPIEQYEGINVATVKEIGLFKLVSCVRRGSKKDVYDLDLITDHLDLRSLLEDLKIKLEKYSDESFQNVFDLDSNDNPLKNPGLLLRFDMITPEGNMPGHSSDHLLILKESKSWLDARSSWRQKVKRLFRYLGLDLPSIEGLDIE